MSKSIDLSIVIPLFNEEEVVPFLIQEINKVGATISKNYEVILVDDGSTDNTFELIKKASDQDPKFKVIKFSRNFGQQAALNAGIDFAGGDMVVTMDGDLQYPPSLIPEFIKHVENGYDIVIGERLNNEQNNIIREMAGRFFYKVLTLISGLEFRNANDFALYNRRVVEVLKKMPERERYLRGIVQWVGFKKKYIKFSVSKRGGGVPKYNFKKLTGLVLSGITSFSAFPLRLAFWVGLFVFIVSIAFSTYVVWDHYANPNPFIAGWATLVILVLFLGSIQLMVLGVVGEYLYKMFNEVKGRPLYIISETRNMEDDTMKETSYGIHSM